MDSLKHLTEKLIKSKAVTDEIEYFTADEEDEFIIAQANAPLDEEGRFVRSDLQQDTEAK